MRKFCTLLTVLSLTVLGSPSFAKKQKKGNQKKQKSELKEWKQRKAAMQPLQLKDLIEENHKLKASNRKLTEEIKVTKEELEQLTKFRTQVEAQENKQHSKGPKIPNPSPGGHAGEHNGYLAQEILELEGLSKYDWATDQNGQFYIKGLVFKIQIGAYKKRDLSNLLESDGPQEAFEQEQLEGINMYTIRHFRDYWQANKFKKELRDMGLKETWIVAVRDGKRIPLKDVLQEITKK